MKRQLFFKYLVILFLLLTNVNALELSDLNALKKQKMQGNFTQEKILTHFKQNLISKGDFELSNEVLIWNLLEPIKQSIKVSKDGIFTYDLDKKQWILMQQNYDKELILNLMTFDLDKLKEQFSHSLEGDLNKWNLTLTPTNIWLKKIFQSITIYGDRNINSIIFIEKNGDKTINNFSFNQ